MKKITFLFILLIFELNSFAQTNDNNKNYLEVKILEQNNNSFTIIDSFAKYPNGQQGIINHISTNLQYPVKAQKKRIQGVVIVAYTVNIDGSIINIQVLKGVHPLLDNEAIRVISIMDKWLPAYQRGKPVKTTYKQPFNFKL